LPRNFYAPKKVKLSALARGKITKNNFLMFNFLINFVIMKVKELVRPNLFGGELTALEMESVKGGAAFGLIVCCNFNVVDTPISLERVQKTVPSIPMA
jgi:hypothetical protein